MKTAAAQGKTRGVATLYLPEIGENGKAPATAEPRSACDGPRLLGSSPSDATGGPSRMPDSLTPPSDDSKPPRRTYQFDSVNWRREALRSTDLTDAAKVLAAVMADSIRADGSVSVARRDLARCCGCSERQISERLRQLVEVRFLDRVSRGQKQRTAVYKALRQDGLSARLDRPLNRVQCAVSPDTEMTVEPHTENRPLSVAGSVQCAAEPRTSSRAEARTKPRREREPVGSTSELLSMKGKGSSKLQTEEARALIRRACESWNLPVPPELAEGAA